MKKKFTVEFKPNSETTAFNFTDASKEKFKICPKIQNDTRFREKFNLSEQIKQ